MTPERFFGCHVSIAGGLHRALETAEALNINALQIHPSPPQRWNSAAYKAGVEDEFMAKLPSTAVRRIFFHGIYLINLANPDERAQQLAKLSLVHDLDLCTRMNANGVVFHVGSMKHEGKEERALALATEAINRILDLSQNNSPLLLEVSAGGGTAIGQRFEQLAAIYAGVENKSRVGVALDTQHLWASGYNLPGDLATLIPLIDSTVGLSNLKLVHFNDSKTKCGSRVDRHDNIGEGLIGLEPLREVLFHPALVDVPFILETPAMRTLETALVEVNKVRGLLERA